MSAITQSELTKILENHQHWLHQDCDGWETMRADLHNKNLAYVDLSGRDLSMINFQGAILCRANLSGSDLSRANLSQANLSAAILCSANLYKADLHEANLSWASLHKTNLSYTNLHMADLYVSDLYHANITGANLYGARLCGAINIPYIPMRCPEKGSFIGFKKAGGYIVKLEIPEDAKRSSATTKKCRCSKAKVLEIQTRDGTVANISEIHSEYDSNFVYSVGEITEVKDFSEDRWEECAAGIHFFMNREDAVNY